MKDNPPAAADAPALAKFAKIGIVPGRTSMRASSNADFRQAHSGSRLRPDHAPVQDQQGVKDINGWGFTTKTGLYGTDYLMRALVTAIGLGANRPQDAVYPTSLKDAEGKRL